MECNFFKSLATEATRYFMLFVIAFVAVSTVQASTSSEKPRVAVIYPQVREPYIRIFQEIIDGIVDTLPYPIEQYGIPKDVDIKEVKDRLDRNSINSVIMLGSRALKISSELAKDKTVLTGAVFSNPKSHPVHSSSISLIASPEVVLNHLIELAPATKTVHVVYNSQKDAWIIEQAREVLSDKNVTLNAIATNDVRGRAQVYNDLLKSQTLSNVDALWLLQSDKSLKEPRVFASILESAWKQNFIVFSANPTHVRKGALFAMYPDNKMMGASLANKLLALHKGETHSIETLGDMLIAVNIRTAEHLELEFPRSIRNSFNMVFPSR